MTRSTQLTALLLVTGGLSIATGPAIAGQCSGFSLPRSLSRASAEETAAQKLTDDANRAARAKARQERRLAREARAAATATADLATFDASNSRISPASCHAQP